MLVAAEIRPRLKILDKGVILRERKIQVKRNVVNLQLGSFMPIATVHPCCARYSLGTRILRHTSSARTE